MDCNSYVYIHTNISNGDIFYIGIGTGRNYTRAYSKRNRNNLWNNYVNKHGYNVTILFDNISNKEACSIEIKLISKYKRKSEGGLLTNISLGGDNGLFGVPRTKEHQAKIATANKGRIASEGTRLKQRNAKLGRKHTPEHIQKSKDGLTGQKRLFCTICKLKKAKKGVSRAKQTKEHIESRRLGGSFKGAEKKIICLNNNTVYNSAKDAAKALKISDKHIGTVCNGKRNHTGGYKFKHL